MLLPHTAEAQSPNTMSYQVVTRDDGGNLVRNSNIGVQISILQGTIDGSPVFVERHYPSTNTNGLVTISIATGTTISGDFSSVDWANGPYFIKTETDLKGGANYTLSRTNQLLSVPYALHAKTAESITGGVNETDPVYSASVASNITSTDVTNWNDKLSTEVDGSVTNEMQNIDNVLTQNTKAGNNQIKNLATPTDDNDIATKAYVDMLEETIEELNLFYGLSKIEDVDGNSYKIIEIGNQVWMAENLKVTKEADGTPISLVTDNTAWADLGDNNTDKAYCYYSNSTDSLAKYGALYTYAAALVACPSGWHLPTDTEWTELEDFISNDGHSGTEGAALKSNYGWKDGGNGTDDYDFTALAGGYRFTDGSFTNVSIYNFWWSHKETSNGTAGYDRFLSYSNTLINSNTNLKSLGLSVRCVRD